MPKRKSRSFNTKKRYRKRARTQPRRAYSGSMVPLRSGGYSFNAPEVKMFNKASAVYQTDANTATITSLCTPVPGTGFTNRIGTKIKATSIYIRGHISNTQALTATGVPASNAPAHQVRCTVVIDYQPNGQDPAITDVFTNATPISQLNLYNRDRFKILMEKTWVFDPILVDSTVGGASAVNQIRTVKMFKKCAIPVFFNAGVAGTVADLQSNNIVMIWQSDWPAALTGNDVATLETRIRFVDP